MSAAGLARRSPDGTALLAAARAETRRWSLAALAAAALSALLLMPALDAAIARYCHAADPDLLAVFAFLTMTGDSKYSLLPSALIGLFLLLLAAIFSDSRNARPCSRLAWSLLFIFAAIALSGIAVNVLKILIGRARPDMLADAGLYGFFPPAFDADFKSYPSGHANTVFALGLALGFLLPQRRWVILALCVPLAATRVFVHAHYLSDIVGGAAVAVITTFWLRDRFLAWGFTFPGTARQGSGFDGPGAAAPFQRGLPETRFAQFHRRRR